MQFLFPSIVSILIFGFTHSAPSPTAPSLTVEEQNSILELALKFDAEILHPLKKKCKQLNISEMPITKKSAVEKFCKIVLDMREFLAEMNKNKNSISKSIVQISSYMENAVDQLREHFKALHLKRPTLVQDTMTKVEQAYFEKYHNPGKQFTYDKDVTRDVLAKLDKLMQEYLEKVPKMHLEIDGEKNHGNEGTSSNAHGRHGKHLNEETLIAVDNLLDIAEVQNAGCEFEGVQSFQWTLEQFNAYLSAFALKDKEMVEGIVGKWQYEGPLELFVEGGEKIEETH